MKTSIYLIAALIAFCGCSSVGNKKLDEKISNEATASNRSELRSEAKNSIDNAINLTTEQKQKLSDLRTSVSIKTDQFDRESLELRSVLLKDLLATNYNPKEISLIKRRMRKLEDRRLSALFEAADKANVILGREAVINHAIMGEFVGNRDFRQ